MSTIFLIIVPIVYILAPLSWQSSIRYLSACMIPSLSRTGSATIFRLQRHWNKHDSSV